MRAFIPFKKKFYNLLGIESVCYCAKANRLINKSNTTEWLRKIWTGNQIPTARFQLSSPFCRCRFHLLDLFVFQGHLICSRISFIRTRCKLYIAEYIIALLKLLGMTITTTFPSVPRYHIVRGVCCGIPPYFFSILLTHEGSHRELYQEFQPSYDFWVFCALFLFPIQLELHSSGFL